MRDGNSISDTLWELGVTHERDEGSKTDQCHTLYFAGRSIGRYSAHEVADLIREHGLEKGPLVEITRGQTVPCGECHLRHGETCDICDAKEPPDCRTPSLIRADRDATDGEVK